MSKMIPKIIHYCWFGHNDKPQIVKDCMNSWREIYPDWEIKEWNETNFDISQCKYMEEAYSCKKWAFVSDVARLIILYNEGGIYLDTDVELLAPIPESLFQYDSFFPFEMDVRINTGMGFASQKGNPCLKYLIEDYANRHFLDKNMKMNLEACTFYNTNALEKYFSTLLLNDSYQVIDNNAFITTGMYNQFASHHYASSWTNNPKKNIEKKREWKDTRLKRILRNPNFQKWIRTHLGYKANKVYMFISYDLLEAGLPYYLKRFFCKFSDK